MEAASREGHMPSGKFPKVGPRAWALAGFLLLGPTGECFGELTFLIHSQGELPPGWPLQEAGSLAWPGVMPVELCCCGSNAEDLDRRPWLHTPAPSRPLLPPRVES